MKSHEQALTLVLAGGPVPLEAAGHVASCPACQAELEALRAVETGLRGARPAPEGARPPALLTAAASRRAHRWFQSAAAAALLLGLLGGFAAGRGLPRTPAGALETAAAESAYSVSEDSTFTLLSAAEALEEEPSAEELATYLESHWGG